MYLHKTVRAFKKLFALEGGVGIGVKSNERCGTVHVMQRYEARTRKSEVVRWPGGIRHWQCGSARGGKGGTSEQRLESSSSESFLRCTQPATIPRRIGVTDLRLESKRKRLTSIRRAQVRLNSPILAKLSRYPEIIYLPLASSSFTGNRILIQSQVAFSVTKYLIQSKIKLVTKKNECLN